MNVVAVSSGGGHWAELMRLKPALADHRVHYVTVQPSYVRDVPGDAFSVVTDATRWSPLKLMVLAMQIMVVMIRYRPEAVVSTGAAPGLFAIIVGKLLGARTVWVDSLANVDELSGSGRLAGRFSDLWLTQWETLAREGGPEYAGKVL